MSYETRDTGEHEELPQAEAPEPARLSPAGRRAMQGHDASSPSDRSAPDDLSFDDHHGRPITVRSFPSGDQFYVRAYDRREGTPPERVDRGQAGRANVHLERNPSGDVARARLQDVEVEPDYRSSGIGSVMLDQAEQHAQQHGAREVYGSLSYEPEDEQAVRGFYRARGYDFRSGVQGGEEVYKPLAPAPAQDTTEQPNVSSPVEGTQEQHHPEADWVDTGIRDVPVGHIDTSDMDHVNGPEDFQKVSYEEMVDGFHKLDTVVRPAVEEGADGDYFYNMDRQQGLDYANGYQRVYDAFYGGTAIRLNKDGERYNVVNGYHRLYVADRLGVKSIPARVIERR